jgi:FMN phosphatase YigB (HAD superfamily)
MSDQKGEAIALFDLDGTLADFDGAMQRDMDLLKAPDEPSFADIDENKMPPHIIARRRLIKKQPGWWLSLDRLHLGFDIFELAGELDFHKMILSKAPDPNKSPNAWSEKALWCAKNVPGTPITLSDDKGMVYGKVLVDDWPPYVKAWLKHRPRGLVIMPAHRWNVGKFADDPRVVRYDGSNFIEVERRLEAVRKTCISDPPHRKWRA